MKWRIVLILVLVTTRLTAVCQDQFIMKKDLKADWKIFVDDSYKVFNEEEKVNTVYFSVNAKSYKGDHLVITNDFPFSVMANGKLIGDEGMNFILPIDSLSEAVSTSALFFA